MEFYINRAGIIKPKISRNEVINLKALILEYNEIKDILLIDLKIEYIENIILEFLKNPEIMARYPKFRIIFMRKYKELKQSLKRYSVTSDIIETMPIFLEIIKNRSDYVKHTYNLRSLKTNK
jgi:hypothetical protein